MIIETYDADGNVIETHEIDDPPMAPDDPTPPTVDLQAEAAITLQEMNAVTTTTAKITAAQRFFQRIAQQ